MTLKELKTLEMTRQELINEIIETYANSFKADYVGEGEAEEELKKLSNEELIKELQEIELRHDMDYRYEVVIMKG